MIPRLLQTALLGLSIGLLIRESREPDLLRLALAWARPVYELAWEELS